MPSPPPPERPKSGWFDAYARFHPELLPEPFTADRAYCESPAVLALEWCTDAPNTESWKRDGNLVSRRLGEYIELSSHQCPGNESFGTGPHTWGITSLRGARFLQETRRPAPPPEPDPEAPPSHPPPPDTPAWIYPMAVGYDYAVTTSSGDDPCDLVDESTTSRDSVIASNVAPGTLSEYVSVMGPSAEIPRCGISEREFTSSTSCEEAMALFGASMPPELEEGYFHLATGAALVQDGSQCWLREPRRFFPTCPEGLSCTAGGECVGGARPPTEIVSLEPPAPAP